MRDALLKAIDDVRDGRLEPGRAKVMASLAREVTASLDVELKVMIAAKIAPLALANEQAAPPASDPPQADLDEDDGVERANDAIRRIVTGPQIGADRPHWPGAVVRHALHDED